MWNKWEHEKGKPLKAEKYKEKAFIDIYKIDEHYEIICSISEHILFHTIFSNGRRNRRFMQ